MQLVVLDFTSEFPASTDCVGTLRQMLVPFQEYILRAEQQMQDMERGVLMRHCGNFLVNQNDGVTLQALVMVAVMWWSDVQNWKCLSLTVIGSGRRHFCIRKRKKTRLFTLSVVSDAVKKHSKCI